MDVSVRASKQLISPALLSILLIISRWRIWDDWGLDRTWGFLLGLPIGIAFIAAIIVRFAAIQYRNQVLEKLQNNRYEIVRSSTAEHPDSRTKLRMLDESDKKIAGLHQGPFGPISQDYLLGAAVLLLTMLVTGPAGAFLRNFLMLPI